jgi:hypothetical protein
VPGGVGVFASDFAPASVLPGSVESGGVSPVGSVLEGSDEGALSVVVVQAATPAAPRTKSETSPATRSWNIMVGTPRKRKSLPWTRSPEVYSRAA